MLAGTEILARTGDSLSRAQQVAIETDEVGKFEEAIIFPFMI